MVRWIWSSYDLEASVVCLDKAKDEMEIPAASHTVLRSCE
jgi:hypothetical protein